MFLILSIFLLLCCYSDVTKCGDFFLIHNYHNGEFYCVTNSSYGLAWVNENYEAKNENRSMFTPSPKDVGSKKIFQNLEKYRVTGSQPKMTKILDRRWEDLKIEKTEGPISLNIPTLQNNFRLTFSVKIQEQARLFLSEGADLVASNNYQFTLSPNKIKVIKHKNKTATTEKDLEITNLTDLWRHFQIIKFDKNITILPLFEDNPATIENSDSMQFKNIFIQSVNSDLWKLHITTPDFKITEKIENITLGPISKYVCLNFFLLMCTSCQLTLTLVAVKDKEKIDEKMYSSEKSDFLDDWKEIRIEKDVDSDVMVLLSTTANNTTDIFWFIDKIRLCQKNELRFLSSKTEHRCQLLNEKRKVLNDSINYTKRNETCPDETIGSSCLPCFWNFSCSSAKIWEATESNVACSCASNCRGENCSQQIYQCSNVCHHGSCDLNNGICVCDENYSGTRCEKDVSPVFARAPLLKSISQTEAVVSLTDLEVVHLPTNATFLYRVQYKKLEENEWMQEKELSSMMVENDTILIKNLIPDTKYLLRRIVLDKNGTKFENNRVPVREFKTDSVASNFFFSKPVFIAVSILNLLFCVAVINTCCLMYKSRKKREKATDLEMFLSVPLKAAKEDRPKKIYNNIKSAKFENYVKDCLKTGQFMEQHESILQQISYDIPATFYYDYISFEDASGTIPKAYIVTEMPTPETYSDFWEIIWKENIENTVFLNNTKQLVHSPIQKYRNITVQFLSSEPFAYGEQQKFLLTFQKTRRYVKQLVFTSWTEEKLFMLVPFFQMMSRITLNSKSPLMVYCCSGLEGTGFALLCDMTLRASTINNDFMFHTAGFLSNCCSKMVSDFYYFMLAHLVILESTWRFHTVVSLSDMSEENMKLHHRHLQKLCWIDQAAKSLKQKNTVQLQNKNPYSNISESEEHLYEVIDRVSTIVVEDYGSCQNFFVTQQPTHGNLGYFWEMVAEQEISKIVAFEKFHENKILTWFPSGIHPEIKTSKTVTLKHIKTTKFENYIWVTVELTSRTKNLLIDVFFLKSDFHHNISYFIKFCIESKIILEKSSSNLITCSDGVTESGLFVAILYNMKMAAEDGRCDICKSVRILKTYHPTFVKSEQLGFLWTAVKTYLKEVDLYQI